MAIKRFSISTDDQTHAAIRAHARACGLDVSAYLVAAARQLMAQDDLIAARFADIDKAIAHTEAQPATPEPEIDEAYAQAMDDFIDGLSTPPSAGQRAV